jgi:hypothetical protein
MGVGIPKKSVGDFLNGKSSTTIDLFNYLVAQFQSVDKIALRPTKTMVGIVTTGKPVAYITQFGKDFIHLVFPLKEPHTDNLCFLKIAQVPGDSQQFNHHFRMYAKADVNIEVMKFIKLACKMEN